LSSEVVVVEPPKKWPKPQLRTVFGHRDLAYFLSWRDIKIRYKQSLIGFGWAVLQPLGSMLALTLAFHKLANVSSEGVPYPVFVLPGIIPWSFFANAVAYSSSSLTSNLPLITKVYFPRVILPISAVMVWVVDLGIATLLMFGMMAIYGIPPKSTALLLPLIALFVQLAALGFGLWLSAINVKYRDVQHTLPFLMQLWFFLTPVIYAGGVLTGSGPLRLIYGLNPMVGAIELFRWAAIGTPAPPIAFVAPSVAVVVTLLITGWIYFMKTEQAFADVI